MSLHFSIHVIKILSDLLS